MEFFMKSKFIIAVLASASLIGCSSVKMAENEGPIRSQKLATTFTQEGVTIETDCAWYKFGKTDCDIIAIESRATTDTNGSSTANRNTALTRASLKAKANVRHFLDEKVTSNRVNTTIAKNIEKAADKTKTSGNQSGVVSMTDKEADADSNSSVRDNSNETAHQVTETVRANAEGILRGFRVVKQEVTGSQEVAVTIRWDLNNDRAAAQLRKRFGG
jgi:hypothetical protein